MEVLATAIRQTKETKGIQVGIEEVKYSRHNTIYRENPRDSTQKLCELINEYKKVERYKINIQKLAAFLYTNNGILEKDYKNTTLLKIVPPPN